MAVHVLILIKVNKTSYNREYITVNKLVVHIIKVVHHSILLWHGVVHL